MQVQSVGRKDYQIIQELNEAQKDFKLSNLEHSIIDRIVYDGAEPIAYGIVKKMAEAIILVNPSVSKLKRAEAMRQLMLYAEIGAKQAGCEQLHVFLKDEKLGNSLARHFNFTRTESIVMVKGL